MARQEVLKDKYGNRIGTIEAESNGRLVARDKHGNRVGEYDPRTNVTRDRYGNRVAERNVLAALVGCL